MLASREDVCRWFLLARHCWSVGFSRGSSPEFLRIAQRTEAAARTRRQCVPSAGFYDSAIIDNIDQIGPAHRRDAVRYEEYSGSGPQPPERIEHARFAGRIEIVGRLVEPERPGTLYLRFTIRTGRLLLPSRSPFGAAVGVLISGRQFRRDVGQPGRGRTSRIGIGAVRLAGVRGRSFPHLPAVPS